MKEILAQQRNKPHRMTGKEFWLSIALVLLKLAIAQILCNVLISATGVGLLNIAFYLYAVVVLFQFMRKTVAGSVYMLKEDTLILQKCLGDSTTSVVMIALDSIIRVRPVYAGERLKLYYKQVTVMDARAATPMRIRLGWWASLISARLARKIAGKGVNRRIGYVIVYDEAERERACVFCPNEEMCDALADVLGKRFAEENRVVRPHVKTLYGRALQRAFPELYKDVVPLVTPEQTRQAMEEIAKKNAERESKKQKPRRNKDTSKNHSRDRSKS